MLKISVKSYFLLTPHATVLNQNVSFVQKDAFVHCIVLLVGKVNSIQ